MQLCNRIYYSKVYWRLNRFRAAHRSSSGALNCICSLWFIYPCGDRAIVQAGQRPITTWVYKPEAANTVWSSWWWAVCRSKHVEPSVNFGIINSITRLHLVGYFCWFILRCTDPWILNLLDAYLWLLWNSRMVSHGFYWQQYTRVHPQDDLKEVWEAVKSICFSLYTRGRWNELTQH
jgi:hypothetical protein